MTSGEIRGEETDVVIVGAGGSGIAAALAVVENGGKAVVVEKNSHAGGTTNFVEGTYAVDSDMQRRRNVKATRDEGFRQLMEYSHWRANAALVRAIVNKSGETIAWLQRMGVEFVEPTSDLVGGPRVWHLFKGFGNVMMQVLVARAEAQGVTIHYRTTATKALREGKGPMSGIIAVNKEGVEMRIQANTVIIASGGYADNHEWIKKHTVFDLESDLFSVIPYDKTGEGIEMAWSVGAAEEGTGVLLFNIGMPPRTVPPDGHMLGALGQPTLWVNRDGVRFCDEWIIQNMIHAGNALTRQPGRYCFRIFDEEAKRQWETHGGLNVGNYSPPGLQLTKLDAEIATAVENKNPYVFAAASIPELADMIGVDRAALVRTVDKYNTSCDRGYDDEFGKDREYLWPLRSPRFYAIKCYPDFLCTLGGIKINKKMEALDKDDHAIQGLYAVGCDAGGMYGDSYDVIASGIGSSFALNSGRIAGENAVRYLKART
jgi:fumarate reductase flavoprotein subunit